MKQKLDSISQSQSIYKYKNPYMTHSQKRLESCESTLEKEYYIKKDISSIKDQFILDSSKKHSLKYKKRDISYLDMNSLMQNTSRYSSSLMQQSLTQRSAYTPITQYSLRSMRSFNNYDLRSAQILNKGYQSQRIKTVPCITDTPTRKKQEQLEEKKYVRNLFIQQQHKNVELDVPDVTDPQSTEAFYSHFKKLDFIVAQNQHLSTPSSVYTQILKKCQKKQLLPSKIGIIQTQNENNLNLQQMRFGDNYMKVLASCCKNGTVKAKNYLLGNNRIGQQGASQIIKGIASKVVQLDLQGNRIGEIGIDQISRCLQLKDCKIQFLNLEDNQLGSKATQKLLQSLSSNLVIKVLNLSKNNLEDTISEQLRKCIEKCTNLLEIYLHWNQFKGYFGKIIFEQLKENDNVKVLDLSNNSLGFAKAPIDNCAQILSQFLLCNKEMVHMWFLTLIQYLMFNFLKITPNIDLSFNMIQFEDTIQISKALEQNKTIFGFHFTGNNGYVDNRGFLIPQRIQEDIIGAQIKKRIKSIEVVAQLQLRNSRDQQLRDRCWICEGWREIEFEIKDESSNIKNKENLFLHLNYEDFRPCYLGPHQRQIKRMVPPGELNMFYSNSHQHYFLDDLTPKVTNIFPTLEDVQTIDDRRINITLKQFNKMNIQKNYQLFSYFDWQGEILPRQPACIFIPPKNKKIRIKWKFPDSVFTKYVLDDPELIYLCFEYDWDIGKVSKIIKNQEETQKVKEFFRSKYKYIKDTYKYYATSNPVGDVWTIQQLAFQEMSDNCKIIDAKLTPADITVKWTSAISGVKGFNTPSANLILNEPEKIKQIKKDIYDHQFIGVDIVDHFNAEQELENELAQVLSENEQQKYIKKLIPKQSFKFNENRSICDKNIQNHINRLPNQQIDPSLLSGGRNPRNPERGLNRYQMMEILVRIAEEKYINKYQATKSHFQAIQMFWKDNLRQDFIKHDSQYWRENRFWTEQCDLVLKTHKKVIENVYKRNSSKKVKPGQSPFMSLDELNSIIQQCGLLEEPHFGTQVYLNAYNLSMMTQIDELTQDRISQMSIIEFQEALARIAEEACIPPAPGVYDEDQDWLLEKRKNLPLGYKLEGLMLKLLNRCTDIQFKLNYPPITKSLFWIDPEESDFDLVD